MQIILEFHHIFFHLYNKQNVCSIHVFYNEKFIELLVLKSVMARVSHFPGQTQDNPNYTISFMITYKILIA